MDPKYGGPAQGVKNIFPYIVELGFEIDIITLDPEKNGLTEFKKLNIVNLGPAKSSWSYSNNLDNWLASNLEKYNLVIVHGLWQYSNLSVYRAYKKLYKINKSSLPLVYTMCHGMLDPWFQQSKTRRFKSLRNYIYWHTIESKIVNSIDGLLFTCDIEKKLARTTFSKYYPKKEITVGYGIAEPPAFCEQIGKSFLNDYPFLNGKNYLLYLGRIDPKKGLDIFVKAVLKICDLGFSAVDLPYIVVAGPIADVGYARNIKKIISTNNFLKEKIIFCGLLTGESKWGAIYSSEAFFLTSHQENFGISVVEAMACKKPVLISDQINIYPEIIENQCGLLCETKVDSISEMLLKWLSMSKDEKSTLGLNAFNLYKKMYTAESASVQFVERLNLKL